MATNWVDFRAVKNAVTMRMALDHYGVNWLRKRGDELAGRCPIHKGEGTDTFHVNLTKNAFHCFSCQAKGNVLVAMDHTEELCDQNARSLVAMLREIQTYAPSQPAWSRRPFPSGSHLRLDQRRDCQRESSSTLVTSFLRVGHPRGGRGRSRWWLAEPESGSYRFRHAREQPMPARPPHTRDLDLMPRRRGRVWPPELRWYRVRRTGQRRRRQEN